MTVSLAISRIRQIRGEEMPKASTFVKKASDKVGLAVHLNGIVRARYPTGAYLYPGTIASGNEAGLADIN